MNNDFSSDVTLFFEDPWLDFENPRRHGVLYLLRRDILVCLGWEISSRIRTNHRALWPAAIAVFVGIDLLAKFYFGSDEIKEAGERFKGFVTKYFSVNPGDEKVLYQLRNAFLHSFGLYGKSGSKPFKFGLSNELRPLVERFPNDEYLVDLATLHSVFDKALEDFRADLNRDKNLQINFAKMFSNYGTVTIRPVVFNQ